MKIKIIILILFFTFCSISVNSQTSSNDESIQKLPLSKKKQISVLLKEIYLSTQVYLNSTDDKEIVVSTTLTLKKIRNMATTLPKGFFKDTLISGAGAWEKWLFFRYDEIGNSTLSLAKRKEIIEVYKLEKIAPEDRASKLFDFAQAFFDIAADVAVSSEVPIKSQ